MRRQEIFGRRLRACRALLGLEQDDLARLTGIVQAQLSQYERGSFSYIDLEKLVTLARVLHTTTDYLLDSGNGNTESEQPPAGTVALVS